MEKIVSQLDANGYFVAPVVADESPLEPGVFLLPGGAVDVAPPAIPDGMLARWVGQWVFESLPEPEPAPPEEPPAINPIPQSVTRRQALLALLAADLLDDVEAIMAAAPRAVQIAWDASSVFERDNPLIASMAEQLDLSDEDVDALFVQASTL